jgi:cyclase
MMRERIADDVYVFTSRRYAQVTAGAVLTKEGAILIDTLFFPEETKAVKEFLEERCGAIIRYVINTHYHADHTQGTYLFPEAQVVSHALCRQLLDSTGRAGLARAQAQLPELGEVQLRLPDFIFSEGALDIHLGGKTVHIRHLPGHSADLVGVMVLEERILFASDNMMPVPTLFDGRYEDLVHSLQATLDLNPVCLVQGHGEVVLRGEMEAIIQSNLDYLHRLRDAVGKVVAADQTAAALQAISIESCGKSRIPLNGLVADLHQANLRALYEEMAGSPERPSNHHPPQLQ